ncbi:MAG TPA: Mur ligase family protein [Steroidobacteraceae bacterium]|nr:Mur ligase family protein [Steroidobacteraceae bacterium]
MLPFDVSRRLIGANLFFASTGAVLETQGVEVDEPLLAGWHARAERARARLGWRMPAVVARRHGAGASLALAAPCDQLMLATEVNEWALCATLSEADPPRRAQLEQQLLAAALESATDPAAVLPPVLEESAAFARFAQLSAREARPGLMSVLAAAAARDLPHLLDDEVLTLGAGAHARDFGLAELPAAPAIPWGELADIPTALVTGSNGKTTTVRLLAACTRAQGWPTAYCCTDGVFLDRELLAGGDYSGPAGGRMALRERRAYAAVLETARGGILRRGLAASRAGTAVVTNISADHFGEYGVESLAALADVKLTVAAVVARDGLLVLSADDPLLVGRAPQLAQRFGHCPPLGWFALDDDAALLAAHRARGGATCGVRDGRLRATRAGTSHDLGAIADMPLTVAGSASYNIANLAGAALAALALGVAPGHIARVFARFGLDVDDNAGRLMRFERGGVQILIDYAHNPEGLRGLLTVAEHLRRGAGRLGLLLGHAGNRQDREIQALARVAAEFHPALIVIKENEGHLRGRAAGEVPRILREELLLSGLPEAVLPMCPSELAAARYALDWAQPGDVLALPVHAVAAREAVLELLSAAR